MVNITLARNLFVARNAVGLSQDQLARKAGVSRATVIKLEAGESDPCLSTVEAIAGVLRISIAFLLFGQKEFEAVARATNRPEAKAVKAELPKAFQEEMQQLVASHVPRQIKKAVEMGVTAVAAAYLSEEAFACAAIGTLHMPGAGTAIGAALSVKPPGSP